MGIAEAGIEAGSLAQPLNKNINSSVIELLIARVKMILKFFTKNIYALFRSKVKVSFLIFCYHNAKDIYLKQNFTGVNNYFFNISSTVPYITSAPRARSS